MKQESVESRNEAVLTNEAELTGDREPQMTPESKSPESESVELALANDEPCYPHVLVGADGPDPSSRSHRRTWIGVLVMLAVCVGAGIGLWKFNQWHEYRSMLAACQSSQKALESAKATYDQEYAKDMALGASIVKDHPQYANKLSELKAEIAGETVQQPLSCSTSMSNNELSDNTQMNQQSVDAFTLADSLLKDGYSYAQNAIKNGSIDKQQAEQMISNGLNQMNAAK